MIISKDWIKTSPDLIANRITSLNIYFLGEIASLSTVEFRVLEKVLNSSEVYHLYPKINICIKIRRNHTNSKLILQVYIQHVLWNTCINDTLPYSTRSAVQEPWETRASTVYAVHSFIIYLKFLAWLWVTGRRKYETISTCCFVI